LRPSTTNGKSCGFERDESDKCEAVVDAARERRHDASVATYAGR
jgi:hypothetical protein